MQCLFSSNYLVAFINLASITRPTGAARIPRALCSHGNMLTRGQQLRREQMLWHSRRFADIWIASLAPGHSLAYYLSHTHRRLRTCVRPRRAPPTSPRRDCRAAGSFPPRTGRRLLCDDRARSLCFFGVPLAARRCAVWADVILPRGQKFSAAGRVAPTRLSRPKRARRPSRRREMGTE
jgi:hypothetical protein